MHRTINFPAVKTNFQIAIELVNFFSMKSIFLGDITLKIFASSDE